ncbi:MAG: hypothetical protein IH840_09030 [Candidatus Heimdallarchaeota archaeon]|nr:hypothetical protein [Candidatus Heimdallarchaeota archaeon]
MKDEEIIERFRPQEKDKQRAKKYDHFIKKNKREKIKQIYLNIPEKLLSLEPIHDPGGR